MAAFPVNFQDLDDWFNFPVPQVINRGVRRQETRYPFVFTDDLSVILEEESADEVLRRIQRAYDYVQFMHPNALYRLILVPNLPGIQTIGLDEHAVSTPFRADPIQDFLQLMQGYFQRYDEDSFKPYHTLVIAVTPNPTDLAASSGHSQMLATNDYLLISPHSRTNCAFTAIAICKGWKKTRDLLTDHVKQNQAGTDIKRRRGLKQYSEVDFANLETLEAVAKELEINLIIYHNDFRVFKKIDTGSSVTYKVQNRDGHMWAMIPRLEVMQTYKDFEMPKTSYEQIPTQQEQKPYKILPGRYTGKAGMALLEEQNKPESRKPFNEKIAAWDIEAYLDADGNFVPYMVGLVVNGWSETLIWDGEDCLSSFVEYLEDNIDDFEDYTFYAHNGSSFDIPLLLKYALLVNDSDLKISSDGFVVQDGNITSLVLESEGIQITFRDSMRLLIGSLDDLTREFDVEHKKLTGSVDHEKVNAGTWRSMAPEIQKYLEHDCFGLLEVVLKFAKAVYEDTGINVTSCISAASLAKQNYFRNYYKPYDYPIYYLSKTYDKYVRRGYFGGRVECGFIGKITKTQKDRIYYFDFTSLYPDQGRKSMPYGEPKHYIGPKAQRAIFNAKTGEIHPQVHGFVECYVTGPLNYDPETMLPVHGTIHEGKLVFPVLTEKKLMVLGVEEMRYAQKMGIKYEYEVVSFLEFRVAPYMKVVYEDAFNKKAQAKKDNNPAKTNLEKIKANSTYGFWGFRAMDRDQVLIGTDTQQMNSMLEQKLGQGRLKTWANYGPYTMLRLVDNIDIETYNPAISAQTTMYSRMRIHQLLVTIKRKGGKVYYWDTDSVITNFDVLADPETKQEFMWDGCGDELGSLKNEATEIIKKALAKAGYSKDEQKQIYEAELKADGGQFTFDTVNILGCKAYCLTRKWRTVQLKEIFKFVLKGIRKNHPISAVSEKWEGKKTQWTQLAEPRLINASDYDLMARGGSILQAQMQFRSGNQSMLRETDKGGVRRIILDKCVKSNYTKGKVLEDGFVVPLELGKSDFEKTNKQYPDFGQEVDLEAIQWAPKVLGKRARQQYQNFEKAKSKKIQEAEQEEAQEEMAFLVSLEEDPQRSAKKQKV